MKQSQPNYQVSSGRKVAYYAGLICMGVGLILFLSVFYSAISNFGGFSTNFGDCVTNGTGSTSNQFKNVSECSNSVMQNFANPFIRVPVAFGLMILGMILTVIGRAGLAGSGFLLNPKQARTDLEPFNRSTGGMIQDALEEIPAIQNLGGVQQVVKVRCQNCNALSDEHAKFCGQCGKPI
jgi:hypothetical protein